jgi:hypothetical protein
MPDFCFSRKAEVILYSRSRRALEHKEIELPGLHLSVLAVTQQRARGSGAQVGS